MKIFLLGFILLGLVACEENVPSYDTLSDDEQGYIRGLAAAQCLADSLTTFQSLGVNSNNELAKLKRGDFWKITNQGVTDPDYIYVWKVAGNTVYFLYQQKMGTTYHQFFKITADFNNDMIQDHRIKKCAAKDPAITAGTTSLTYKDLDVLEPEGTTRYRNDKTYKNTYTQPAFFALFDLSIFKEKLDDNDTVVSTSTVTNTVVYESDDAVLFDTYGEYSNRRYCVFAYNNVTPKTFNFPYQLNCIDGTGNANTFGDATQDFQASDLNPPYL